MDPMTMAAVGTAVGGTMSFKGQQAQAKQVQQIAEYNARVAENEKVALAELKAREEVRLRAQSDRLVSTQRTMTAASGVQMTGSPALALADTFFATEADALNIQQASSREQAAKTQEAAMIRLEGRAKASGLKYQSYASLINSGSKAATLMG
jgi:DsbC/DsbD-like thiol-disulfide interchange protein